VAYQRAALLEQGATPLCFNLVGDPVHWGEFTDLPGVTRGAGRYDRAMNSEHSTIALSEAALHIAEAGPERAVPVVFLHGWRQGLVSLVAGHNACGAGTQMCCNRSSGDWRVEGGTPKKQFINCRTTISLAVKFRATAVESPRRFQWL
jgi:hypothetical protein